MFTVRLLVLVYRLNQDLVSNGFYAIHKALLYHVLVVIHPQILNLEYVYL